jgi:acyl-CoA dehydrogenase family protein 9
MFATACVLSRTQGLIDQHGEEASESVIALCDMFCVDSGRRFRGARSALDQRDEEVDDRRRTVAAAARASGGPYVGDPILEA